MTRCRPLESLCALICVFAMSGCSHQADTRHVAQQATVKGMRLSPDPAYAASRIDVVFADRWVDPAQCRFLWKRNGALIEDAHESTLQPTQFAKGDRITVLVTVTASPGEPEQQLTADASVVNTPPKITRVTLGMNPSPGPAEVQAQVECSDPDGDTVSYGYTWFKNGTALDASGPALATAGFERGDRLVVQVVASDGESTSPPVRSEPFGLENHAPRFTSSPVAPTADATQFRYQLTAVDPDGDAIRFELVKAPNGMSIDRSGLIAWWLPPAEMRHGAERVTVRVTDDRGGEAQQEFVLFGEPGTNP